MSGPSGKPDQPAEAVSRAGQEAMHVGGMAGVLDSACELADRYRPDEHSNDVSTAATELIWALRRLLARIAQDQSAG